MVIKHFDVYVMLMLVMFMLVFFVLIAMPMAAALADSNNRPIMVKVSPFENELFNGNLASVLYSVGSLKDITVFYGTDYSSSVTRNDCESGKLKTCNFENIDLSQFDGKSIYLLFRLTDMKNTVYSKKVKVRVDTTAPELKDFDYSVNKERVSFMFEASEKNFKEISHKDLNDCGDRDSGFLCRNLIKGKCSVVKEFCGGTHYLTIKITDKAGNSIEKQETIVVK